MKCQACSREAQDKYCKYHGRALQGLQEHYKAWVKAYGQISWHDFLTRLIEMKETGTWVKEVISVELKK
jgi:hypothetical protein